jgi:serine/threonine protein kinase
MLGHFLVTTWLGTCQNLEETYFGVQEGSWRAPDAREIYANFVPFVQSLFRLHNYAEIIHGDISPANMVRDVTGRFALIDFGFAFPTARTVRRVRNEGTPGYAAPEQSGWGRGDSQQAGRGREVNFRSDQFAASAVLYRLLTGNLPYEVLSGEAKPGAQVRPPSRHSHTVWPSLDRVVLRGLELGPDRRFPNTREWLQTLEAAGPPESVMPEWLTRSGWHMASWLRRE